MALGNHLHFGIVKDSSRWCLFGFGDKSFLIIQVKCNQTKRADQLVEAKCLMLSLSCWQKKKTSST